MDFRFRGNDKKGIMLNYAVFEISGKQYKVMPGKSFIVDWQGDDLTDVEAKLLLLSEDGKVKIGNPYLKDELKLEVLGSEKGKKIRVAKFHAKANYRKVTGIRPKHTRLVLKGEK